MDCDVAIIGGGPAGATVGALLKKYDPSLDVAIFEAERFPRDHVGESLLTVVAHILHEMGVWDKVEEAGFPIKVGATYRWGLETDQELWHFYFTPEGRLDPEPRPATFEGQRTLTAFQVDRSVFDKILLDHCRELGCRVYEAAKAVEVEVSEDRIAGFSAELETDEGTHREAVTARYYIDASGVGGVLRKALNVPVESPTSLRNIAIWDYWQNAEWAEKVGVGGTFIQVMSLGWGWLWFIPLSPTRTSIGLVTSASYYKQSAVSTEELYVRGIAEDPRISALVANAEREGNLKATRDWSFVADRMCGKNWFLVGDSGGFADPILSAGMTLAMMGARRAAYTILELERGGSDVDWLSGEFDRAQRKNLNNHIRFADYWYSANSKFTDLKEYCSEIARDSGLTLDPERAFQWLGTGGFSDEIPGVAFVGAFRIQTIKQLMAKFTGEPNTWAVRTKNLFDLDLEGATERDLAVYDQGRVARVPCYERGGKILPVYHYYGLVFKSLRQEREIQCLAERIGFQAKVEKVPRTEDLGMLCYEALEAMVGEGWVRASYDPSLPLLEEAAPFK